MLNNFDKLVNIGFTLSSHEQPFHGYDYKLSQLNEQSNKLKKSTLVVNNGMRGKNVF